MTTELTPAKCPCCASVLMVDSNKNTIFFSNCGACIIVHAAIAFKRNWQAVSSVFANSQMVE